MTLQNVTTFELDGQLGVLPAGQRALAMVGPSDGGTVNTPAAYAVTNAVRTAFTGGILVEAASWHIETKALPVLLTRCAASVAGTCDAVDSSAKTGTSAVTMGVAAGNDEYEIQLNVVLGGTIATGPITIQVSCDGGRTFNPAVSLGTATTYVIPNTGGLAFAFAAGTLVTGDIVKVRAHAPSGSAADVTAALNALKNSNIDWEICVILGDISTTVAAAISTVFSGLPEKCWIGGVVLPTSTQTEATYSSTLATAWSAVADSQCVGLCAGAARFTNSGINPGRLYAKSITTIYASQLAAVPEHIDISQRPPTFKAQKGTYIADNSGNPAASGILLHDERLFPGLDDLRFVTLQSVDGAAGAYFTNPNCFSTQGSDFQYAQHRRVMNKLKRVLRLFLQARLSVEILVNASTGFILESEAQDIEFGAAEACRTALAGQVSAGGFNNGNDFLQLSRTDNLLSSKTLNANGGAVPLAYPKAIILNVGYKNPALRVQAVPGT